MVCKNCLEEFKGNFCNNCGQKIILNRLYLKDLLKDFIESFNFDSGLLLTLKELFFSPHILLNNYINGKRKKYYNPVKLLILFISLNVLITTVIEKKGSEIELMNNPFWIIFSFIIFVPTLSFFTYLISKKKYNFTENIVINLYSIAIVNLILILDFIFRKAIKVLTIDADLVTFSIILLTSPVFYITWVYTKVFRKNFILLFFFSLFTYLISYLLFFLTFQLLGIIKIGDFAPHN